MPQFRSISPLTLLASACVAFLCSCASTPGTEGQPEIRVLPEASSASEPASASSGAVAQPNRKATQADASKVSGEIERF